MTTYNNKFITSNKCNLRSFINKAYIREYYASYINSQSPQNSHNNQITQEPFFICLPSKHNTLKQGWNDPSQTENARISRILTGTLGGKTTFGNFNKPTTINYLGGWEGQPGGLPKPLRNKF